MLIQDHVLLGKIMTPSQSGSRKDEILLFTSHKSVIYTVKESFECNATSFGLLWDFFLQFDYTIIVFYNVYSFLM